MYVSVHMCVYTYRDKWNSKSGRMLILGVLDKKNMVVFRFEIISK